MLDDIANHIVAHRVDIPIRGSQQSLHPIRDRPPARSATVQEFFFSNGANNTRA